MNSELTRAAVGGMQNCDGTLIGGAGMGDQAEPRDVLRELSFHRVSGCTLAPMRVLGIDCGSEYTGYGVVDHSDAGKLLFVAAGTIRLSPKQPLPKRLDEVFNALRGVISEFQPDEVAIEDVFYAVNAKSALKLGQVRGVAMLAAASSGLEVAEYAPLSIKSAVVGYGKAEKAQVQHMVAALLNLSAPPKSEDAADALAIAICHLHTSGTRERQRAARA